MTTATEVKKELSITRILNAPRDVVFKAWIETDQLAEWWGPKDFTNPVCEIDAKPGGSIYIDMKGPDGVVYPMNGFFNEINEPEKISFTCCPLDENKNPLFEVFISVTFFKEGSKTRLTLKASVSKARPEGDPYIAGMDEGWNQSLDRLEELSASKSPFVIERTFNALATKVWKAISDRDEMAKWYFDLAAFKPEVGFEFQFTGGTDEKQYLHLCKVMEVVPGEKLTYSWRYDGYEGNSFVTFELFPEGDKTKLKLTHKGLETFPANNPDFAKKNFEIGWTEIVKTSLKNFLEPA